MCAVGFLLFARELAAGGSDWLALFSFLTQQFFWIPVAWVILTYPSGHLGRGLDGIAFAVIVIYLSVAPFIEALTFPRPFPVILCEFCDKHLLFFDPIALADTTGPGNLVTEIERWIVPAGVLLATAPILRRLLHSSAAARRVLTPVWIAALAASMYLIVMVRVIDDLGLDLGRSGWVALGIGSDLSLAFTPLVFMLGLLSTGLLQGSVGRLVDELNTSQRLDELETVVRRALRDRTARIFYMREGADGYFDSQDNSIDLSKEALGRAVTPLEYGGVELGAVVHDRALVEQSELVQSICAAVAMALANARLQAKIREQLSEVEASRARIVTAADAERRRIERNLHDGAQQRLVALRLSLSIAAAQMETDDPEKAALLRSQEKELNEAIAELREIAHGIHPAVLTDEGLSAAVEILIQRTHMAVNFDDRLETRAPAETEAAAYYVIAEGLTNAQKHAQATRVTVSLTDESEFLTVIVADNGSGGARVGGGSGLVGLTDRVAAIGGTLEIETAEAQGTTLRARLPMTQP